MNNQRNAFDHRFDAAVDVAHESGHRSDSPSASVWSTIRSNIKQGTTRAETADPRAMGPDLAAGSHGIQRIRKESNMEVALSTPASGPAWTQRPWMSWAVIAIIGVLLASSLFTAFQPSQNDGNDDLAWAPGLGTPESTPPTTNTCTVDPLTTDQVMETVLNPNKGYIRLAPNSAPNSDSFWEPEDAYLLNQMPTDSQNDAEMGPSIFEPADEETSAELENTGSELWACLQQGTSFQVWGILDPILVQKMILDEFPVIRTESALRAHIEEVGPTPFIDSGAERFSALSTFSTSRNAIVTESHVFEPENPAVTEKFARVHFAAPDQESFVFRLYLREIAPNVWIIYELTIQPE